MNKKIDNYIRLAMEELNKEKSLDKEFKGYLASLGPAINMSGLIPAIAFYSSKEDKTGRLKVLTWIFNILKKEGESQTINGFKTLLEFAIHPATDKKKLQKDIEDISIALKLTLRTFSLTD